MAIVKLSWLPLIRILPVFSPRAPTIVDARIRAAEMLFNRRRVLIPCTTPTISSSRSASSVLLRWRIGPRPRWCRSCATSRCIRTVRELARTAEVDALTDSLSPRSPVGWRGFAVSFRRGRSRYRMRDSTACSIFVVRECLTSSLRVGDLNLDLSP